MSRLISASLSPNAEAGDVWLAFRLLFTPWAWKQGGAARKVEQKLHGVSFNSGRAALLAILRAFAIGRGDEVICQAFTCVAVPNSVLWSGATPIFVDITSSYTMDPTDFEKKITKKTKAVIVQHTFGFAADMQKINSIAKKHGIRVIEDFAHSMSIPFTGDAAFYSFGRDKVLSSVFGGLAVMKDDAKLKTYHKKLEYPSYFWIFQQLLHPVTFAVILPLYRIGIGKVILVMLQRLRLLSFPVYPQEKQGKQPADFPAKYPNALATLLLKQLKKLERFTRLRNEAVGVYGGTGPLLRYPMRVNEPEQTREKAKKRGILLGNWYHNVIDPYGVDFSKVGYKKGSCPKAEEAAAHVINLPTRISVKDAKRILASL